MGKLLTLLTLLTAFSLNVTAQQAVPAQAGQKTRTVHSPMKNYAASKEALQVEETTHDFGTIPQGRPVTYDFVFTNTGNKPIFLNNVQATCGCTTPEWSPAPVAPGASASIKVGFNAATEGRFSKNITVTYNNDKVKTLEITGNVYPMPATSAPLNASLSQLQQ